MFSEKESGAKINMYAYEWLYKMRSTQILVFVLILMSKALYLTERLEIGNFKASGPWLDIFHKWHMILFNA